MVADATGVLVVGVGVGGGLDFGDPVGVGFGLVVGSAELGVGEAVGRRVVEGTNTGPPPPVLVRAAVAVGRAVPRVLVVAGVGVGPPGFCCASVPLDRSVTTTVPMTSATTTATRASSGSETRRTPPGTPPVPGPPTTGSGAVAGRS